MLECMRAYWSRKQHECVSHWERMCSGPAVIGRLLAKACKHLCRGYGSRTQALEAFSQVTCGTCPQAWMFPLFACLGTCCIRKYRAGSFCALESRSKQAANKQSWLRCRQTGLAMACDSALTSWLLCRQMTGLQTGLDRRPARGSWA